MKRLAISYKRYSSGKQSKGSSYERQQETENYCRNHGLTLIDHLEDLGVSGWTGANLEDTAALGGFLKEAQEGKIPKGTTLILENLNRLTRGKIMKATNLLTSILLLEIDVVTTMDGQRYTSNSDMGQLLIAVTIMSQANQESENKSKYVKAAWVKKRAAINRGEFVKMTQYPNWLEVQDGARYVLRKDAAKTVKLIFELYASGKGSHVIAKELNAQGIKPFSRIKHNKSTFTFSSIERLLKTESVIGTCDVVDPPKKGYWPPAITEELWYKVQALRQQNNHYKGTRNDVKQVNFLAGIAVCSKCGAKMVRYSCTGKNDQRYHYLTCSAAKYGEHSLDLTPYELIQESFISGIQLNGFLEPFLKAKTDTTIEDKTAELQGKLVELEKTIGRVSDAIVKTDSAALVERLSNLEQERKELRKTLEDEIIRVKGASNANAAYYDLIKNLDKRIKDNDFRMSLRNFLRGAIDKVVIGRDEKKRTVYSVYPKDTKDVVKVELGIDKDAAKSYRVSLNGQWQVGLIEFN